MSVNIYDGTNLIPIAGKTVPAPTPDYVDEQFNPSTTYSLGMTCIEGNVRYRYKNSTATSGHRPPDTTYWEVFSVATQIKNIPLQNRTDTTEPYEIADFGTHKLMQRYFHFTDQVITTGTEVVIALPTTGWGNTINQNVAINSWVDEKSVFYKKVATTNAAFDVITNHRTSTSHSGMTDNVYIDLRLDSSYTPKIAVYQSITSQTSMTCDGSVWINYFVSV